MLISSFLFCGLLFCFHTFAKIFNNKEQFLVTFEQEFGEEGNLNAFLGVMFLTSLLAWPILMLNELNNKQDL